MSVESPNSPEEKEADAPSLPPPEEGQILVPRWVILLTFVLGWGAGGSILFTELSGQGRLSVMVLAAWLITLPLVAGNPFGALREMLGGLFTGRK